MGGACCCYYFVIIIFLTRIINPVYAREPIFVFIRERAVVSRFLIIVYLGTVSILILIFAHDARNE